MDPSPLNPLPPQATVREVTDVYFGHEIVDPYRWMEEPESAELAAWLQAQDDHARRFLDALPLRDELLVRQAEVSNAGVTLLNVQRRGDQLFYVKQAPGDENWRLCVRDGFAGPERTLLDTETPAADGTHHSITWFDVSHDGRLASCLVSPSGSEYGAIRVVDVATGREVGERIERTRWTAGVWLPDGRSFAYFRFRDLPADAPPSDGLRDIQLYVHTVGSPPDRDRKLFGWDVDPGEGLTDRLIPDVYVPLGSRYIVGRIGTGVSPNAAYYVAPIASLHLDVVPWRRVARLEDEVSEIAIHEDDLYALTYKDAPSYKVVRTRLSALEMAAAEVVIPESDAVVERIAAARDALYVGTLGGGVRRLHRVDYRTGRSEPIEVPQGDAAVLEVADEVCDGMLFRTTSWTRSPALCAYDPHRQVVTDTGLIPPVAVDMSGVETIVTSVPSHDGARIPLVILMRRDVERDGTHPALLTGYGAYGATLTSPAFSPHLVPWLERGGVYAIAGVRGGGEHGEAWHLAGKEATKPNTWLDFIACAEYLVLERYTRSERLAGEGSSAGGILISNAIAERPDLFGAAIINVGLTNALRMETTANGAPNVPEFGSCATEAGFSALRAMDAYHKIRPGVAYPDVLLTHGIHDPRVNPWFSAKMTAQLQRQECAGQVTLLRIDYDAGHGLGSTKAQRNGRLADVYAFLFERLGGR